MGYKLLNLAQVSRFDANQYQESMRYLFKTGLESKCRDALDEAGFVGGTTLIFVPVREFSEYSARPGHLSAFRQAGGASDQREFKDVAFAHFVIGFSVAVE